MTHTCTKVTVRQRAIRNNRISLYLDYYPAVRNPETMQMSRREYLGITRLELPSIGTVQLYSDKQTIRIKSVQVR